MARNAKPLIFLGLRTSATSPDGANSSLGGKRHARSSDRRWWKMLGLKLLGHYRYYGMSGNFRLLQNYYHQVVRLAFKWINR
ncbi:MAG: hypothetical protein U9N07_06310, partial [Euryarchaeota archaeon]|nr:hypothetical protein [Euryarchaeota archaeon]